MRVLTVSHPDDPAADMALTGTLLRDVAAGRETGVARVFQPGPTVAFGRRDRLRDGFGAAEEVARRHGFEPVVRHGGGLAVAYDRGSVLVEIVAAETRVVGDLERRFAEMTELIGSALSDLGVETQVGELPGEYCPGRFSLHLVGGPKLVGMAQRVISGASLTTAAISVGDVGPVRAVLTEVYGVLGLELDPATVGAVVDHDRAVTPESVAETLETHLRRGDVTLM